MKDESGELTCVSRITMAVLQPRGIAKDASATKS
jgi:hypothetical protein